MRLTRRLLHVITVPDSLIFFDGQLAFMKRHGFEIALASSPGPGLEEFGRREGVDVHPVEMPRRMTPVKDAKSLAELHRVVRRVRPDIVHSHTAKGGMFGMLAATAARVPVRIYQMRGRLSATGRGLQGRIFAATERVTCGTAHHVICNSRSLRDAAISEGVCAPEKLEVLLSGSGNGVDSTVRFNPEHVSTEERRRVREELGIPADAVVVGFVGRLVGDKGIAELVHAWRTIRERATSAHLVVVGAFEPRDPVSESDSRFLESTPDVHLLGFRRDLPRLYASMDIVVLPSYREGFPNVLLEAQSMGLPVVSTRVEGCVDAVDDGVTGTLVPARDAGALCRATLAYLENPALRRSHGEAGRERVLRSFARERLWEALLGVYDRLLSNASRPRTGVDERASRIECP